MQPHSEGDLSQPVRFTRAAVDAGTTCTRYVRAGAGAPVLVLDPDLAPGGAPGALVLALATRFRVVTPEIAELGLAGDPAFDAGLAFSAWLRQFLDGLGLPRV